MDRRAIRRCAAFSSRRTMAAPESRSELVEALRDHGSPPLASSWRRIGVAARRSETKSAMVKSVSWPTPEITGTGQAPDCAGQRFVLKDPRVLKGHPPRTSSRTSVPSCGRPDAAVSIALRSAPGAS